MPATLGSQSYTFKNKETQTYRIIILSAVLYGCEAWSLTVREGQTLRVFENRVLRKTSGPRREGAMEQKAGH
jgi:hypothetical protein